MKLRLVLLYPALYLLCCAAPGRAEEDFFDPYRLAQQGNAAYQEGRYEDAIVAYQRAISGGADNGHLYYNLGNTQYRLDRIGEAIASLRRAKRQLPRNEDILANLSLVREAVTDDLGPLDERSRPLRIVLWPADNLSPAELKRLTLAAYTCFWLAMALWVYRRGKGARRLLIVMTLTLAYGAILEFCTTRSRAGHATLNLGGEDTVPAVVIAAEAAVRSGNGDNFQAVFMLHDGAEVLAGEVRDDWVRIFLPGDREGWVRGEQLVLLEDIA